MLAAAFDGGVGLAAGLVGILIGATGGLAWLFVASRTKGLTEANTAMSAANQEMRDQSRYDQQQYERRLTEERDARHDQELKCAADIAELRGQLNVLQSEAFGRLTDGLAERTVEAVREGVRQGIAATSVDGGP